jgi:hypothetical protein
VERHSKIDGRVTRDHQQNLKENDVRRRVRSQGLVSWAMPQADWSHVWFPLAKSAV